MPRHPGTPSCHIMFTGVEEGGWFGSLSLLYGSTSEELALLDGNESAAAAEMGSPLPPNSSGTRMQRYPASVSAATNSAG